MKQAQTSIIRTSRTSFWLESIRHCKFPEIHTPFNRHLNCPGTPLLHLRISKYRTQLTRSVLNERHIPILLGTGLHEQLIRSIRPCERKHRTQQFRPVPIVKVLRFVVSPRECVGYLLRRKIGTCTIAAANLVQAKTYSVAREIVLEVIKEKQLLASTHVVYPMRVAL